MCRTHSYVSQIGKVTMGKRFTEKMIPDIYGKRCPVP